MNLVKKVRKFKGYTQSDMATYLGISLQSYYRKENMKLRFNDNEKVKIKKLFNEDFPDLTIDKIFFEDEVSKVENEEVS